MRFELDDDERALVELTSDVLRRERGQPDRIWKGLFEAGVLGAVLPESVGGSGLGAAEAGLVLQAVGKHAVPVPVLGTLFLGALPLAGCAGAEALLACVTEEGAALTAALGEPGQPFPTRPRTTAERSGSQIVVRGTKIQVPDLEQARHVVVSATLDGEPVVLSVPSNADGVSVGPKGRLGLDGVRADALLGGADLLERLQRYAAAGAAALGAGVLDGALELTVAHIGEREQFGRPIATFQSAAAQIADVSITARAMRLTATSACWRLGRDLESTLDCAVAGYWLGARALETVHTCHHLHGGIGVDMDYPLHRHYGLIKWLAGLLGGAATVNERMGQQVMA